MSVIVTGMDAPKKCSDCDFCHGYLCKITKIDIVSNPKKDCPLKSVEDLLSEISKCIIPKRVYVLMKDEQYNLGVRAASEAIMEYLGKEDEKCR